MDYIIFSAACHSVISIAILIATVKKKDIINIMSNCCLYHGLTICFVANHSTNKELIPDNLGILIFLYVIIGCVFYMLCCIILERKKEKEEYIFNKNEMDIEKTKFSSLFMSLKSGGMEIYMKNKVINIVIILLCLFAIYINYLDKYKIIGLLCICITGVLALRKNREKRINKCKKETAD